MLLFVHPAAGEWLLPVVVMVIGDDSGDSGDK